MEFKINELNFHRPAIAQLCGGKDVIPSEFQSFLAIDFFNHESIVTEAVDGYDTDYKHYKFSFTNTVDDFYLRFIEKDFLIVDVFMIQRAVQRPVDPNNALQLSSKPKPFKVGTAKLPLSKLMTGDCSRQGQQILRESE
jgi:hypothetical protein